MEENFIEKQNFDQVYNNLDETDKKELSKIRKMLENIEKKNPNIPIKDRDLKKRIAKICLKLISETPNEKISIMETSYIISGYFFMFEYGDSLDGALGIACDLELPEHHVPGDVLTMWDKMKKIFQRYLK